LTNAGADVVEVAPGVHRVAGARVSWYVVVDGDELTLIDTGWPGETERVLGACAALGRSPSDVTAVVVTHGHADHIGAADMLRREHGAVVHAHLDEEPNLTGERVERISMLDIALRIWQPRMVRFVANSLRVRGLTPDHVTEVSTFSGGEALDVPGRPVPVATPGHTSGHCAVHLPERGALLTGDGLVTIDIVSLATGPRVMPHLFNHDHRAAIASLSPLRDLDAAVVLPGHGEPFLGSPADAVDRALARLG
jgi:glyoxylase-like metal-dependent hydrolase (beta-lactamase superfamily II)